MGSASLLEVRDLTISFGGVTAVNGCSFDVQAHTICGLIGPNGSGKTTVFNLITGLHRPTRGAISFRGRTISGLAPYSIAKLGIGRTFQVIRVFPKLTVLENLLVAAWGSGPGDERRTALGLLEMVGLAALQGEYAANLSYGQQKLLEFVRVLVTRPDLILLDEPFAGINPTMENILVTQIQELKRQGKTFLIIDHEMKIIMAICDHILALDHGEIVAAGPPREVQGNERVLAAYFGH